MEACWPDMSMMLLLMVTLSSSLFSNCIAENDLLDSLHDLQDSAQNYKGDLQGLDGFSELVKRLNPNSFSVMRGKKNSAAADLAKRLKPNAFSVMRGKKDHSDSADLEKRLNANSFSIMRGKKDFQETGDVDEKRLSASAFNGLRGKKSDGDQDEDAAADFDSSEMEKRLNPNSFSGMRGKREFENVAGFNLEKRFNPNSFSVMRGKKDVMELLEKRLNPKMFSVMRGKKNSGFSSKRLNPNSFSVMRGKRDTDDALWDDSTWPEEDDLNRFIQQRSSSSVDTDALWDPLAQGLSDDISQFGSTAVDKRQPPRGFVVLRGKRFPDTDFRLKKTAPPNGFYGPRGKKASPPIGFQGVRGKRQMSWDTLGLASTGLSSARSVRSYPNFWNFWNTNSDARRLQDLFSKRRWANGFHPMRG